MDEIVIHYIVETVYMVAGLAIGYLWRSLRTGHRDYGLIKEGVCALLRDRLLHKLEKCLEGGYCTTEARDDVNHMFSIYQVLGGNGTIPPLIRRVMSLPVDPPEAHQ